MEPDDSIYSYSSAQQTVTIPSDTEDVILRFWLYTRSTEESALTC